LKAFWGRFTSGKNENLIFWGFVFCQVYGCLLIPLVPASLILVAINGKAFRYDTKVLSTISECINSACTMRLIPITWGNLAANSAKGIHALQSSETPC